MVVRLSVLRTGRFYPRKCSWYSFLLEAESTPEPQCDRKDFMSMKNSNDTSALVRLGFKIYDYRQIR